MPAVRDFIGSRGLLSAWVGPAGLLLRAALLSLAACGGEPVFTKLFTSEHFDYYVEEGATPPCDGAAQWLERYYSANAKFLGATLPPGERIQYYLVRNKESLLPCPPDAPACADGTTIYAFRPLHLHEIVHANASLMGNPPALFTEGLAEVLSCPTTTDSEGPLDTSEPIETLVETRAFNDWRVANGFGVYNTSASFVRFLIDEFGSSRFLSFYARVPWDASRQEIEAVFQAEFGVRLDEAFSAWRMEPLRYFGDKCLRVMDCDPSMPSLTDTDVTLSCGPWGGFMQTQEALLRFEVPNDRILHVTVAPVPTDPYFSSSVRFYRCAGGDAVGDFSSTAGTRVSADRNWHIDPAQPGSAFALDVPPGEYVAWFAGIAPEEIRIHLDAEERLSPMRNPACQPAEEPLALDDKHPTTLTTRWIERPCQGPWCPGQSWDVSIGTTGGALEARVITPIKGPNFSPGELYICSEPCPEDTSHCEILALDPEGRPVRSTQTFEPGTVLHLGAPAAPFADRFAVQLRVAPE
ncbi:hypothetical protein [Polyangium sp. 15x6]|uniref:hypothetical protein n=1 Tax=Polyangium sp. 15x6 TaxID=3042687 RepID=UPI00249AD20D|nr:hypothetical protein [Polyangium sp. 15x6]MDI3290568.1 hypothetical protein [Polyangium sp. 15x6]